MAKLLLVAQSLIPLSNVAVNSLKTMTQKSDVFSDSNGLRVVEEAWGYPGANGEYIDANNQVDTRSNGKNFMEHSSTAGSYADHEGAHCVYSWNEDARNLTSTCGQGCKLNVQTLNPSHNGKVPQTGIYVSNYNVKFGDGYRSDPKSIVKCNNEFGCHANDKLITGEYPTYVINATAHDTMTGVRGAQPHGKHGASPAFVRKAVCKCNMGFTAPLQLQSSWCGMECPGPDCALRTKTKELNDEWCDDLNDGRPTNDPNKKRCKLPDISMFNEPSRNPSMESSYM
jgi:hypothetical protein